MGGQLAGGGRRGLSVAQEIERIEQAIRKDDQAVLVKYGGLNPALRRSGTLKKLPEGRKVTPGQYIRLQ